MPDESPGIAIPDAIGAYALNPATTLPMDGQRRLMCELFAANGIAARPVILNDPQNIGIDHPALIITSPAQTAEELLALFCVYISLDRRKPLSETQARRYVAQCLSAMRLRAQRNSVSVVKKLPNLKHHGDTPVPPPPAAPLSMASWITTKAANATYSFLDRFRRKPPPPDSHWLLRFRSLTWEDFVREAFLLCELPPELFGAERADIRSGLLRTAVAWFDVMVKDHHSTRNWDITMEAVWEIFDKFEN